MDKFNLSWINLRENYDALSRSDLLPAEYKKNKESCRKIIDMGCGNGSFLRWCYKKNIMFDEMSLIDNDNLIIFFNSSPLEGAITIKFGKQHK